MSNKGNQKEMNMIEAAKEFETAKDEYKEFRREEKERIIGYLKWRGYFITEDVDSSNEKYDSNWMCFNVEKDGKAVLISLQTFDKDHSTGNYHVLLDRIGIYIYTDNSQEKEVIDKDKMLGTNIDLPMTDESVENLVKILDTIIECLNRKEEMSQEQERDYQKLIENDEGLKKRLACLEKNLVPVQDGMGISKQLFNVEFSVVEDWIKELRENPILLEEDGNIFRESEEELKLIEEFKKVKKAYKECRQDQKTIIKKYLSDQHYEISKYYLKQHGDRHYKSKSRGSSFPFEKEYDNTNWMYLDVEKEGKSIFISLQTFDRDPESGNYHVLMDRIGIYIYTPGSRQTKDAIHKMLATSIDLPMTDDSRKILTDILKAIIAV